MPTVTNAPVPPLSPVDGDLWFNTVTGREYVWYIPISGVGVWVQTQPSGSAYVAPDLEVPIIQPPTVSPADITRTPTLTISAVAPLSPLDADLWWSPVTGQQYVWYNDGNTSQWVISNWGAGRRGDPGPPGVVREVLPGDDIDVSTDPYAPVVGVIPGSFDRPTDTIDWSRIVNEPTTFPPEAHTQDWSTITGKPATFPPEAHTHDWSSITGTPATFPPNGPAGGDLAGTYPNPGLAVPYPTTLPPNGSAGGDLSGTYPNPLIKPSVTNGQVLTTVGGVTTWAAPGGGASISVGTVPPGSPVAGALWWNSELGVLFIYYNDGNTSQWVPAAPSAGAPVGGDSFDMQLPATVSINGTNIDCLTTPLFGAAGQKWKIECHTCMAPTTSQSFLYANLYNVTTATIIAESNAVNTAGTQTVNVSTGRIITLTAPTVIKLRGTGSNGAQMLTGTSAAPASGGTVLICTRLS